MSLPIACVAGNGAMALGAEKIYKRQQESDN